MSQDGKTFDSTNAISGQNIGIVTIAIGFAVLIGAYLIPRTNLWLIIPLIMLEVGIYGMGIAFFSQLRGGSANSRWGNDAHFTMFWSSLVIVVGVMWVVYDQLRNVDLVPAFIAVFLFYFGVTVMLLNRNGGNVKSKVW